MSDAPEVEWVSPNELDLKPGMQVRLRSPTPSTVEDLHEILELPGDGTILLKMKGSPVSVGLDPFGQAFLVKVELP